MPAPPFDDRWAEIRDIVTQEVPEVASGVVEVRAIARLPGQCTKLAVTALASGLDPIGVCVGWKGVHVNAIRAALGGERIDLLLWSAIPEQLLKFALAPGRVSAVEIDVSSRRATAFVARDQVERTRGLDGSNLALASELTGLAIELVVADAA